MMSTKTVYRVAVIGGDGIGPEVLREGQKALAAVAQKDGRFSFEFTEFPWGCEYYLKTGKMMPEDGIETLSHFDAIYLGAVGYPGVPDHISSVTCFCASVTILISMSTCALSSFLKVHPAR